MSEREAVLTLVGWWVERAEQAEAELRVAREALTMIVSMPTTERNPDGVEQAAWSMQTIARDGLEAFKPRATEGGGGEA